MFKAFLFATACLFGTAANAGTILNDPFAGSQYQVNYYEPIGQSFTAIDSMLLSIGFRLGQINPGRPNDPIKLDLYSGTGTGGTLIASRTIVLPANADYSFFTDFDFRGTALTPGSVYSAALSVVGSSPLTGVDVGITADYSGGELFASNVEDGSCCDLNFRVIGSDTGAVPEPATWAMMVSGFGLVGAALRRRHRTGATYA